MVFQDRRDAGRRLAERLAERLAGRPVENLIVLGLPRGGVVVAAEVARVLKAPLDLAVAKKIGHPANPEAAVGAVAEDGAVVLDRFVAPVLEPKWLEREIETKLSQAREQRLQLSGSAVGPDLAGRTVFLVDDGIATGQTMFAAIESVRRRGATEVVVAVPVGPPEILNRIRQQGIDVVALQEPVNLYAVGVYFEDFRQVSDEEVKHLLTPHP